MGQITATRNLVSTKVVRLAGQRWNGLQQILRIKYTMINRKQPQPFTFLLATEELIGLLFWIMHAVGRLMPPMDMTSKGLMMTSSNESIFRVQLVLCEGNPPVNGGFPSQRPVAHSFDVFFDLCLNKLLRKQSRRRWFETSSRSLWRRCNVLRQRCGIRLQWMKQISQ